MSEFIPKKQHLREVLLHYFILKKSATETHRLIVDIFSLRGIRLLLERWE
ncbi:hypothetical protein ALC60_00922 [Trachymyrmex zeteki]|nr:hypothetical protein ALC60_00922 [Trachymyrmex zeteki]